MLFKCKQCGFDIEAKDVQDDVSCPQCGTNHSAEDIYYGSLISRGYANLKRKDYDAAQTVFEEASNTVKQSGDAYIGVLLCEYQVESLDQLAEYAPNGITNDRRYLIAKQKANAALFKELEKFENDLKSNNQINKYVSAKKSMDAKRYFEAVSYLEQIENYRDSKELLNECNYQLGHLFFDAISNPHTVEPLESCQKAKKAFEKCPNYKDSADYLARVNEQENKIKAGLKKDYLDALKLVCHEPLSLKNLERAVDDCKKKQSMSFKYEFAEVKEAQNNLPQTLCDLFIKVCPKFIEQTVIEKDLVYLAVLLKRIEINDCFKEIYELIKNKRKVFDEEKTAKKKKNKSLIIKISIAAACVAVVSIVLGITVPILNKNANYNQANTHMERGRYDDAINLYKKIGNEQRAKKKISVCNGLKMISTTLHQEMSDSVRTTVLRQGFEKIIDGGESIDVYYNLGSNASVRKLFDIDGNYEKQTISDKNFKFYVPTRDSSTFVAWETSDLCYEKENTNVKLTAVWINEGKQDGEFTITYILNGGTNSYNNPPTFDYEDWIVLEDPTREGYNFIGWYDQYGERITEIDGSIGSDIRLEAHWEPRLNSLVVESEDTSKGTVSIISGDGYTGETITVRAYPIGNNSFLGWYNGSNRVSTATTYSFTMPASNYSLIARFSSSGGNSSSDSSSSNPPEGWDHEFSPNEEGYPLEERSGYVSLTKYNCTQCEEVAYRWSAMQYDKTLSNDVEDNKSYIRFSKVENANGSEQRGTHIIYKVYLTKSIANAGLSFYVTSSTSNVPVFSTVDNLSEISFGYIKKSDGTLVKATKRYGLIVNGVEYELGEDPYGTVERSTSAWFRWPVSFPLSYGENTIDIYSLGTYRARMYEYQIIDPNK